MIPSCPPDTKDQQDLTNSNVRIAPVGTSKILPATTVKQMYRAMPKVFACGTLQAAPSQSLDQWAALA